MGQTYALLIAVEQYQSGGLRPVQFAENDAKGIASALQLHGLRSENFKLMLSADATKTRIESEVRRFASLATKDDQLYVFYAGHGFSSVNLNYITCFDTLKSDLVGTSIAIQEIFASVNKSACKRIVFFIDACHSGIKLDDSMRDLLGDMDDAQFKQFCSESQYHMVFSACKPDESSLSSKTLTHGIWSYHVIQAFTGASKDALTRNTLLTASSLQNYVAHEVPTAAKKLFTPPKSQTPLAWGNMTREFLLADFEEHFKAKDSAARSQLGGLKRATFLGRIYDSIKNLSGFKRNFHKIPTEINNATTSFVQGLAASEVAERTEDFYREIKKSFGYKREEIKADKSTGLIEAPDFRVDISAEISPDDPSEYVITTELTDISAPAIVDSQEFSDVFDFVFDTIRIDVESNIDVRDVIDRIESNEDGAIRDTLDYPSNTKSCTFEYAPLGAKIQVKTGSIEIRFKREPAMSEILSAVRQLPSALSPAGLLK